VRLLLFFAILIFSCGNSAKKSKYIQTGKVINDTSTQPGYTFPDTILENKIFDTLVQLAMIKRNNSYIESLSNHKHGIAFIIDTLVKGDTDIFIRAGFNGKGRFETNYQIYINPKTMGIKFYDPLNDKKLSIKEFENKEANLK
jgi:hypothetical protein